MSLEGDSKAYGQRPEPGAAKSQIFRAISLRIGGKAPSLRDSDVTGEISGYRNRLQKGEPATPSR